MNQAITQKPTKLFNRNYFLLWQGQTVSRLGTQVFSIALALWIKDATGSATQMGLVLMLSSLPAVILGPIGGAFADRFSRRKIIIFTDVINGIAFVALAGLMSFAPNATEVILVGLFIVSALSGILSAFFSPAISAAVPDIVPTNRLATANSLGQLSQQLAVFFGQGLGGTLYRVLGATVLFFFNGITYLFSAASETFITVPQVFPEKVSSWRAQLRQFWSEVAEGFYYIWENGGLRELVLVSALLNFFTAPILLLLPFYVEDVLQAPVDWYGFIIAAYGVGALIGYVAAGAVKVSSTMRARLMIFFILLEAGGYGLLAFVDTPLVALGLSVLGGFAGGYVTVNITTLLQFTTPGPIRGRVFGLLATISGAITPISMGISGIVADLLDQNIPLIYLVCGITMAGLTLLLALSKQFRQYLASEINAEADLDSIEPPTTLR